jgi:hypothetical protein
MDKFWAQAAKVLKPGGTVAVWTCCEFWASLASTSTANVSIYSFCILPLVSNLLPPPVLSCTR